MQTMVYVKNQNGIWLMPCRPAKARYLLKAGKAKPIKRSPFTIQLLWDCEAHIQEVILGIDKGSTITGFCCVGKGKLLLAGEIHHRQDVKSKMEIRRMHRRSRRSRKWYRPKRFLNRASLQRHGRIPPSIHTNVEEVIRVVRKIPLPISSIIIEDVQVDIARLNTPDLKGSRYQDPTRLDENLRLACLMRDSYLCQSCHKKNGKLEVHHVIFKSQGGKDTLSNLLTLCETCHDAVHAGKVTLHTQGVSGFLDQIAQRTMQGKRYLYETLRKTWMLETVYGYQTAAYRKYLGLPKTHIIDGLCIATLLAGEVISVSQDNQYSIAFRPRQTRRQYRDLPRKGQGRVKYQVNEEEEGFRKGDIVKVKDQYIKQINSIYSNGYLAFKRIKGEPNQARPKDCRLVEREKTMVWEPVGEGSSRKIKGSRKFQ